MSTTLTTSANDELTEFVAKATSGDPAALRTLRPLLDEAPELCEVFGDLGRKAKTAWIEIATGKHGLTREALTRHVETLQRELAGPSPSVLERLLAERIVLCWLEVHCLDPALSAKTEMPVRHAEFSDRRRDRAHRRYLSALRSLATIRRLLIPSVQLNIGSKQVNIAR